MRTRERHQNGSLDLVGDTWWLRYYERDTNGKRPRRAVQVGTIQQYRTKTSARKRADEIMREVNDHRLVVRFDHLCDAYVSRGIAHLREYSQIIYLSHVNVLRRAFEKDRLDFLSSTQGILHMEDWLNRLKTQTGRPIAASTRRKHKVLLSLMFRFAIKHGYLPLQTNPIQLIDTVNTPRNTSPKRVRSVVTIQQYRDLLADDKLPQVCKVLLQVCTMSGLRSCEAVGLKWNDVDFVGEKIYVRRSVKNGKYHDEPKTRESKAAVPLHDDLAAILLHWKRSNTVINDWVFGSALTGRPLLATSLQEYHLRPAGARAGIANLGWHNFRHTYRALGREAGLALEDQKMLMRHSSLQQTADYGNDGIDRADQLRRQNRKIVAMLKSGT